MLLMVCNGRFQISIHAPREGSDMVTLVSLVDATISIHAPREGSDEVVVR